MQAVKIMCAAAVGMVAIVALAGAERGSAPIAAANVSRHVNNLHGTTCHVTNAQFLQLADGMSYSAAQRVIGCPGVEQTRSSIAGYTTVMYAWDGYGSIGANMNAMFQNDRLEVKGQMGLK